MCYLLFPFPDLGDGPYVRIIDAITAADANTATLIDDGIASLDSARRELWLNLDESAQLEVMRELEPEPFFQYMLQTTKMHLFNDREVWAHIGYGGSSLEGGGYLHRGLNDIDWLDQG